MDTSNPNVSADTKHAQQAADKILIVTVSNKDELDEAFTTLTRQKVSALFVAANVSFIAWRDQVVALAARHMIAASYSGRDYVALGGLMSYGPNQADVHGQVGV